MSVAVVILNPNVEFNIGKGNEILGNINDLLAGVDYFILGNCNYLNKVPFINYLKGDTKVFGLGKALPFENNTIIGYLEHVNKNQ